MKIAQVVCTFPPSVGGIGQSAERLGDILSEEHQVTTFALGPENCERIKPELGRQKVIFLYPSLRVGYGGLAFSLLWRLRSFDLIYLHYPFFGADALVYLIKIFRPQTKLVIHYHMDTPALQGIKKVLALPSRHIFKRLMSKAMRIIASSQDYAESSRLAPFVKKNKDKIIAIPFGIDTGLFRPKFGPIRSEVAGRAAEIVNFVNRRFIKKGRYKLLFVGGLDQAHYFKGLNILLEAIPLVKGEISLDIIGTGDLKEDYEEKARSLKIMDKVSFRGRLEEEELIRQYQTADVLILPSVNRHEAFGLVLIEAMSCGLPVIASDLPGVRSVFKDGQEGLLCKVNDSQNLAQKIDEIISDEKQRQKMGEAARELVLDKYSWEKIEDRILDEFSQIAD